MARLLQTHLQATTTIAKPVHGGVYARRPRNFSIPATVRGTFGLPPIARPTTYSGLRHARAVRTGPSDRHVFVAVPPTTMDFRPWPQLAMVARRSVLVGGVLAPQIQTQPGKNLVVGQD